MSLKALSVVLKKTQVFVPVVYAVVSSLWIFFSDRALSALVSSHDVLTELQTYKGWFFVAVTALLLALLIYWRQRALNDLNASLEKRVLERTQALEKANEELRVLLSDLQNAQNELVRSEKLAALGTMVAGVAHELNTPIGNCLLATSTFSEETARLKSAFSDGEIKKRSFESFLTDSERSMAIVLRNLAKAAALVSTFKQLAADRENSRRSEFRLADVVNEVLADRATILPPHAVTIELDVPAELMLDSYPEHLGQVLSKLLDNAIFHGLDGGNQGGTLCIVARAVAEDSVEIVLSDDGVGISDEHINRIFDPFFSTRFGQGGSGLGLLVVHHLVTSLLGGHISVRSRGATAQKAGSEFIIELPRHAGLDLSLANESRRADLTRQA